MDPLTDASKNRGTGTGLATTKDINLTKNLPKIAFELLSFPRTRQAGGKTAYREQHRHEFAIMYVCNEKHKWTRNGTIYLGKQQCIKYLEYLGDQIKVYSQSGAFINFNEITLGDISQPKLNENTNTWTGMLPVKVDTYGRVGS